MVSFIPLYFGNAGDNNFLKPAITLFQKISPGSFFLRFVVFRLGVVFLLEDILNPVRFLVVVVFFFALGILFSL
jgi:hypothetical protein